MKADHEIQTNNVEMKDNRASVVQRTCYAPSFNTSPFICLVDIDHGCLQCMLIIDLLCILQRKEKSSRRRRRRLYAITKGITLKKMNTTATTTTVVIVNTTNRGECFVFSREKSICDGID